MWSVQVPVVCQYCFTLINWKNKAKKFLKLCASTSSQTGEGSGNTPGKLVSTYFLVARWHTLLQSLCFLVIWSCYVFLVKVAFSWCRWGLAAWRRIQLCNMFLAFSSLTCSVNIAPKRAPLKMWKINVGQFERVNASELRGRQCTKR